MTKEPHEDVPIVISAMDARGAVIRGRVIAVLVGSMILALLSMVVLLKFYYGYKVPLL